MEIGKDKLKQVEVACFFFKEKMNLQLTTEEAIADVESSQLERMFSSFTKKKGEFKETSKELRKELKAEGDMYVAYDDTHFQTGGEGFVVTSRGVYAKSDGTRSFVDFETLSKAESLRFEDNELRADGKLLAVFSGSEEAREMVVDFFEKLIGIIRGTYNPDDEE